VGAIDLGEVENAVLNGNTISEVGGGERKTYVDVGFL
jgi:hypothetical protein